MVDYPYILFILVLSFLTYMEGIHKRNEFYTISLWVVFFFIAFRSPTVGGDTMNYYRFFEGTQNYYHPSDNRDLEPAFLLYNYILGFFLAKSGFLYMIINTVFCLIIFKRLIDKYSSYKTLSVLLFFLMCDYMIYFVALRQGLAIQIFIFGIIYLLENKNNKWFIYFICSFIGFLFHTSILLCFIVITSLYFIHFNKGIYIFLIILTLWIGLVLKSFEVSTLFDFYLNSQLGDGGRYDAYLEDGGETENSVSFIYMIRPSLFGLIAVYYMNNEQINHWFTKIYFVSILITNLFSDFTMTSRLNAGFSVFSIIVFSWVFPREIVLSKSKLIRKTIFVLFLIFLVRSYIIINMNCDPQADGKMHPYKTFLSY